MRVTIERPVRGTPERKTVNDVEIPAPPSPGDYVSHEPSGISGTVRQCNFWWDEDGKLTVTVVLFDSAG